MRNAALACAAAGALLSAVAGQAQAIPLERKPTAAFLPTAQVDFQNRAEVAAFYARVERVARQVCDSHISDLTMRRETMACRRQATDAAVAKLSQPLLTAAHQARSETVYARGY